MDKQQKQAAIQSIQDQLRGHHFYVVDHQGLTVAQTNAIRRQGEQQQIAYRVVKNTLLRKALETLGDGTDYTPLYEGALKGTTSLFVIAEDGSQPAKLLKAFHKKHKTDKPLLKGAVIEGALYLGADQLEPLSKLKSKAVLLAELVALLQSPPKNVVASLQSGSDKLAGILQTLSKR